VLRLRKATLSTLLAAVQIGLVQQANGASSSQRRGVRGEEGQQLQLGLHD
jgi:hypothetical protein